MKMWQNGKSFFSTNVISGGTGAILATNAPTYSGRGYKAGWMGGLSKEEALLTRKEIAAYLRISLVTLTDWVKRGLPSHPKRGRVLFLKSEVLQWIKENKNEPE